LLGKPEKGQALNTQRKTKKGPSLCARSLMGKLLGRQLLRLRRGSVPFTETFPAPAIAALDKARSQVVATAVAADQPLSFRPARRSFV
jgi:hypothetical protein